MTFLYLTAAFDFKGEYFNILLHSLLNFLIREVKRSRRISYLNKKVNPYPFYLRENENKR